MEANCCAAIGNAALRDDCTDRFAKFDTVMLAIIYLLENGSPWVQGHTARTLGNLLVSMENVKVLEKTDACNSAASAVRTIGFLIRFLFSCR